jgi:hypothetical protein
MNNEPYSWRDIRQNCSHRMKGGWIVVPSIILMGIILWYTFFSSLKSNQTLGKVSIHPNGGERILFLKWDNPQKVDGAVRTHWDRKREK